MQSASFSPSTPATQAGFVLEKVHDYEHSLCYELCISGCENDAAPFCVNCVIHALTAPTELKLSKRALFATLALVRICLYSLLNRDLMVSNLTFWTSTGTGKTSRSNGGAATTSKSCSRAPVVLLPRHVFPIPTLFLRRKIASNVTFVLSRV